MGEEEEEVQRIRSNIGTKTVSTALLQALMPKLLKMHEAKYEPMDKVDAEKIMEEILGMKAGLNPDQQADANEEAEMIIEPSCRRRWTNPSTPRWRTTSRLPTSGSRRKSRKRSARTHPPFLHKFYCQIVTAIMWLSYHSSVGQS